MKKMKKNNKKDQKIGVRNRHVNPLSNYISNL